MPKLAQTFGFSIFFHPNVIPATERCVNFSDSTESDSPSSGHSTTSAAASSPPTPDIMEGDQSSNEASSSSSSSSGPITESPPQEYALPDQQDDLKLDSTVSNQELLAGESKDGEPKDGEPKDEEPKDGEPKDGEPTSNSPTQEHLLSRSREGEKSSAVMTVDRMINHDHDQTAVPLPRSPTFHPVNIVSEDGSGQEPREQSPAVGRAQSQQPQLGGLHVSSGHSWRESNVAQPSNASAGGSFRLNDQRRTKVQVIDPSYHPKASPPVFGRAPWDNAPGSRFDRLFQGGRVLPPLNTTVPSSEKPGPHQDQGGRSPSINNSKLPSIAEFDRPPQHNLWKSEPKYKWCGHLPDVNESRRLEEQTTDGRPSQLVRGPTQALGPPLKPLDGERAEAIAQEQWRRSERERAIREASRL